MTIGESVNTLDKIDSDMQGKIDDGQLDQVLELNSETTNSVKSLKPNKRETPTKTNKNFLKSSMKEAARKVKNRLTEENLNRLLAGEDLKATSEGLCKTETSIANPPNSPKETRKEIIEANNEEESKEELVSNLMEMQGD